MDFGEAEHTTCKREAENVRAESEFGLLGERALSAVEVDDGETDSVQSGLGSGMSSSIMDDILKESKLFFPKDILIDGNVYAWCEGELPTEAISEHVKLSPTAQTKLFGSKRRASISKDAFLSILRESFEKARADMAFEGRENKLWWHMELKEGQARYPYLMSLGENTGKQSDLYPIALFAEVPDPKPSDSVNSPASPNVEAAPHSVVSADKKNDSCFVAPSKQTSSNDAVLVTAEKPAIPESLVGYGNNGGLIPRELEISWAKELALASRCSHYGALNDEWGNRYEYLLRYLRYTYEQLRATNLVVVYKHDRSPLLYKNPSAVEMDDCWFLAFNTGLQNPNDKGFLYACFAKQPSDPGCWTPDGFHSIGPIDDEGGMQWTHILSARYVGQADFFDDASSAQIRYKGQDVSLRQDFFDHVNNRIARLPERWICELLDALAHARDAERAKACFREAAKLERDLKNVGPHGGRLRETKREISEKLTDVRRALGPVGEEEFKKAIAAALRDAVKISIEEIRRDPGQIDFSFYPEKASGDSECSGEKEEGPIRAALPVRIPPTTDARHGDSGYNLVVVAIPFANKRKAYRAKTILTVEQAYWDMRLIGRPETGWLCDVGLENGFLSRVGDPMRTVEVDSDGNLVVPYYIDAWIEVKGRPVWLQDGCLIGRGWDANGQDDVDRLLDYPHLSRCQGCFEKHAGGWCFQRDEQGKGATTVLKCGYGTEVPVGKGEYIDLDDGDQIILAPGIPAIVFHQKQH